jgi:hypothetical protein
MARSLAGLKLGAVGLGFAGVLWLSSLEAVAAGSALTAPEADLEASSTVVSRPAAKTGHAVKRIIKEANKVNPVRKDFANRKGLFSGVKILSLSLGINSL